MNSNDQWTVESGELDDPTPTQKIWRPVADLGAEHVQAIQEMYGAMMANDTETAMRAHERIQKIEAEQRQAHQAVYRYLLSKMHP